jgi:hypothetical protein
LTKTEDVDGLLFDDDSNNTENEEPIGTEENKIKRLRGVLEKCLNGSDLYNFCIVHLPITGMEFGVLISMNRAIAYLKNTKIVNDKTPTWVICKKNHKEIILSKFYNFLENSATFKDPTLNGIQMNGGSGVADAARGGVRTQGITLKAPKRYQAAIWHTGLQRRRNGPVELQCRSQWYQYRTNR